MVLDPAQVSGPSPLGEGVRTCPWSHDYKPDRFDAESAPVTSVRDLFRSAVERFPTKPCLGWRVSNDGDFEFWNYENANGHMKACRNAIRNMGLDKGDRVGIYARNCPQWTMVQHSLVAAGMVVVPIYDTLGPNVVEYVCNHAGLKMVFVSHENFAKFQSVRSEGKLPSVEHVVIIGMKDLEREDDIDKTAAGVENTTPMFDFISTGRELAMKETFAEPELSLDDILVIMYTSGTTGDPKGVILTHRNFVASLTSAIVFFKKWNIHFTPDDAHLSYLPLSHIYEQQAEMLFLARGGRIGFYSGDIKLLLSDMEKMRPTVFAGVPRVFARFQQRIVENVESSSFLKKFLFNYGYNRQLRAEQNPGNVNRMGLWDTLVFNKVRGRLLPEAKLVLTGSAPMSSQTNDYLKVCLNCPVVQGYGLTETVAGMSCSVPGKSKSGTVGGPLPGVHVKLADLPDMGYLSTDKPHPRGEICIKGDIVFKGYLDNEEATAASFDEDGFFKTGDVGQWLPDGALQIIDRAKNLFKLSQGEYVSPETLEQEYAKAKLVGQIFVYGNSLQSTLVAVVVPDVPAAQAWCEQNGGVSIESLETSDAFKSEVLKQLADIREVSKFKKYEIVKSIVVQSTDLNELGQGFTVDNNLMTPSFKLKRPQLKAKYGERLDALYSS